MSEKYLWVAFIGGVLAIVYYLRQIVASVTAVDHKENHGCTQATSNVVVEAQSPEVHETPFTKRGELLRSDYFLSVRLEY